MPEYLLVIDWEQTLARGFVSPSMAWAAFNRCPEIQAEINSYRRCTGGSGRVEVISRAEHQRRRIEMFGMEGLV